MAFVKSRINQEIEYVEMRGIHPEDRGHPSAVYEMQIKNKPIVAVLGKPKYNFTDKDVVYFPIYSLSTNETIEAQVGVFEILQADSLKIFDNDGDIDIDSLGEPVLYPYMETGYHKLKSDVYKILQKHGISDDRDGKSDDRDGKSDDRDGKTSDGKDLGEKSEKYVSVSDEDDDATSVRVPKEKTMVASKKAATELESGIFTIKDDVEKPPILMEETQEDAEEISQKYKEKAHNPWIQRFMKNPNYNIHQVESNGDCFFAVVRDAFQQIGYITTVKKLRAILAEKADESVFRNRRDVFLSIVGEIKEKDAEMTAIKTKVEKELKAKAKKAKNAEESKELAEQAKALNAKYKNLATDKRNQEELIDTTVGQGFRNIGNLEEFKEYIQTSGFWADEWAIATLEFELKAKIILFSELSFNDGSIHTVMNCGIRDNRIAADEFFEPKYYIMASYNGDHYKLISYKDKRIFGFHEIPYHTKMLIVNKCVEQTSGLYGRIQDFRDLLARKGIDPAAIEPAEDGDEYTDLYDPEVQFNYYKRASKSEAPGKASGEKIPKSKEKDFISLKKASDWRKKLDDSWMTEPPIEIDGKRWASVAHFVAGARYKKGYPDFYKLFSLDSGSEIAKDLKKAEDAISKTGKHGDAIIRPKEVKIDPDYEGMTGRIVDERKKALESKFTANDDLRQILLMTKDAKLSIHLPKDRYETDTALMELRKVLERK